MTHTQTNGKCKNCARYVSNIGEKKDLFFQQISCYKDDVQLCHYMMSTITREQDAFAYYKLGKMLWLNCMIIINKFPFWWCNMECHG